jgi:hypothetical protein
VSNTRLANFRTFLVMIRPKESLTIPRPIDADATASPAETRTSDGSEGKSSIHLARACLLMMIKWEMKATNWRNVAAGISTSPSRDTKKLTRCYAGYRQHMICFTIWQLFKSNPNRGQALDCTSTSRTLQNSIGLTVYYKQNIPHQSANECNWNHGNHEKGEKNGRGIGLTSFRQA